MHSTKAFVGHVHKTRLYHQANDDALAYEKLICGAMPTLKPEFLELPELVTATVLDVSSMTSNAFGEEGALSLLLL